MFFRAQEKKFIARQIEFDFFLRQFIDFFSSEISSPRKSFDYDSSLPCRAGHLAESLQAPSTAAQQRAESLFLSFDGSDLSAELNGQQSEDASRPLRFDNRKKSARRGRKDTKAAKILRYFARKICKNRKEEVSAPHESRKSLQIQVENSVWNSRSDSISGQSFQEKSGIPLRRLTRVPLPIVFQTPDLASFCGWFMFNDLLIS